MPKAFALTLALALVANQALGIVHAALTYDCPLWHRLAYLCCHGSWLHLAINLWCMLSLVFIHRMGLRHIIVATIIAAAVPPWCMHALPTVGLSGMLFAMVGMGIMRSQHPLRPLLSTLAFVLVGYMFPIVNASLHLHCLLSAVALYIPVFILRYAKRNTRNNR